MLEVILRKLVLLVISIHSFLRTYVRYISLDDRISLMNHLIDSDISQIVGTRAFFVNKWEFVLITPWPFQDHNNYVNDLSDIFRGKVPRAHIFYKTICFFIDLFQLFFQRDLPLKLDLFVYIQEVTLYHNRIRSLSYHSSLGHFFTKTLKHCLKIS